MFATIIQKWNAFKADWQEYQRLRRVAARAWHKLDHIRGKITIFYHDENTPIDEKRCIKTKLVEMPNVNRLEPFDSVATVINCNTYCPHFKGRNFDETVEPCAKIDCPYHATNCEYADAVKEYEQAVTRRRSFWWRKSKTK